MTSGHSQLRLLNQPFGGALAWAREIAIHRADIPVARGQRQFAANFAAMVVAGPNDHCSRVAASQQRLPGVPWHDQGLVWVHKRAQGMQMRFAFRDT